jgi:hypothetical protein
MIGDLISSSMVLNLEIQKTLGLGTNVGLHVGAFGDLRLLVSYTILFRACMILSLLNWWMQWLWSESSWGTFFCSKWREDFRL